MSDSIRQHTLQEWSLDLEDRYCEYRLKDGEHDRAREALRVTITEPIIIDLGDEDDGGSGITVTYKGVYIGDIWVPDEEFEDEGWSNYPAPIIRVDTETPITAGYGFESKNDAVRWFLDRLDKIRRGEWEREHGR